MSEFEGKFNIIVESELLPKIRQAFPHVDLDRDITLEDFLDDSQNDFTDEEKNSLKAVALSRENMRKSQVGIVLAAREYLNAHSLNENMSQSMRKMLELINDPAVDKIAELVEQATR